MNQTTPDRGHPSESSPAGTITVVAVALAGGWLAGGFAGLIPGVLVAAVAGYAVTALDVRSGVAVPVVAATFLGAIIGRLVVRAICLPRTCTGFEVVAGTATAVGAFVGVGLVVALVTRSFDEYRTAQGRGSSPSPPAGDDASAT